MSEKLKLAEKTALDIDRLRDGYRPAARRGAILFFVLSEMALVTTMYQYSLSAFLDVFGLSLKKSLPDSILMKRLRNIMDTLTFNIYNYGCTGAGRAAGLGPLLPDGGCCGGCRTQHRWRSWLRAASVHGFGRGQSPCCGAGKGLRLVPGSCRPRVGSPPSSTCHVPFRSQILTWTLFPRNAFLLLRKER